MNNSNESKKCPIDWTPDAPEFLEDVYGGLDDNRRKCPVPAAEAPNGTYYYSALRYEDVVKVVTDKSAFSSAANVLREDLRRIPVELDPPEHTVMRRLLQPYFVAKRMSVLRPRITEFAHDMISDLFGDIPEGGTGTVEYVGDFASAYPTRVLCATLNLPDEDWSLLKKWSIAVSTKAFGDPKGPGWDEANDALKNYVRDILRQRQENPLPVNEDMASGLLAARFDDQPLTEDQMVGVLRLMVSAGHMTTTIALAIITLYLATHPEAQERLRANPDQVDGAIEEILRHSSPVVANANPRTVISPVTLGDRELQPGDRVLPVWGAGNRDEAQFERPDEVDLDRPVARNLVYGHGIHMCLGAPVARYELGEATRTLLAMTTSIAVDGEVEYSDWWRQRGPSTLNLAITRA